MNAIHGIHFRQGNAVPIQTQADYLRGKMKNTGDHKPELQHRITATWTTVRRLDLLWGKSRASTKLKLRVYDAVIVATLMYGLSSIPFPRADANKIDAFQRAEEKKIKHPCWSRVPDKKLFEIANDKFRNEQGKSCLERLSKRLIERQIVLLAHTIKLDEQGPLKRIAIDETGGRIRSYFRRASRPRTKWYDTTRSHAIQKLVQEGHLPRDVIARSTKQKIHEFIIK